MSLDTLRGLPGGAQMLLMCSLPTATGGVLEGPLEDFSELVALIVEQSADRALSAAAERALRWMCLKIDPECADWLGM